MMALVAFRLTIFMQKHYTDIFLQTIDNDYLAFDTKWTVAMETMFGTGLPKMNY
jgi:hypothetical protein